MRYRHWLTLAAMLATTASRQQRRFGYQLMTGLSCRLRTDVELRIGYRY